jgi:hypothetical protein
VSQQPDKILELIHEFIVDRCQDCDGFQKLGEVSGDVPDEDGWHMEVIYDGDFPEGKEIIEKIEEWCPPGPGKCWGSEAVKLLGIVRRFVNSNSGISTTTKQPLLPVVDCECIVCKFLRELKDGGFVDEKKVT